MRIQDLNNPLTKISSLEIEQMARLAHEWFSGDFMYGQGPAVSRQGTKLLVLMGRLYSPKPRSPMRLYRYWHVDLGEYKGKLVGKEFNVNVSKRRLQSWTTSVESAVYFYANVGFHARGPRTKIKGLKPLVISSLFKPNEIILEYGEVLKFFNDAEAVLEDRDVKEATLRDINNLHEDMFSWEEQQEVIVYTGTKRQIRIEANLRKVKPEY